MKKLPAIFILISIFLFVVTMGVSAQSPTPEPTLLNPGDLAIIGFNFDNPDEFAFVLLRDINPNTKILFTDYGWSNITDRFFTDTSGFEDHIEWVSTTSRNKGEIITILPYNYSNEFKLEDAGDQIFAYQGNRLSPNLIFGINSHGGSWATDETPLTRYNSHLPSSLNSTNSIALSHVDNSIYSGPTSFSSPSAALAGIVTGTWSGDDSFRKIMPTGAFTFTPTGVTVSSLVQKPSNSSLIFVLLPVILLFVVIIFIIGSNKKSLS